MDGATWLGYSPWGRKESDTTERLHSLTHSKLELPRGLHDKESTHQCRRPGLDPWIRKIPWWREWKPTPVFFAGEFHGPTSLAGYSPWDWKRSDMTEHAHGHILNKLFLNAVLFRFVGRLICFLGNKGCTSVNV